jgi:DNA replication and repair protein RecF
VFLQDIRLINFRNHKNTFAKFCNGINILIGENAQGKTNLLEAIYLTCVGRGWRAARDKEMIIFGECASIVESVTTKRFGNVSVKVKLSATDKKSILINDIPISKIAELMGVVNCVFFSPDELRLIKDAPADRRRFLNIDISQIDKSYLYALMRYEKILSQRNAYLKKITATDVDSLRGIDIWDEQLINIGAVLIEKRLQFIAKLTPYLSQKHNFLTGNAEKIGFFYVSCGYDESEKVINNSINIADNLRKQIIKAREKDLRLKTTTVGPHRDDIKIEINGNDVRNFGSQGQQRTVALSIKLAELNLFNDITGESPILLLDDVFSELDAARQSKLLQSLVNVQTIITTTEKPQMPDKKFSKIFHISNGEVKPID